MSLSLNVIFIYLLKPHTYVPYDLPFQLFYSMGVPLLDVLCDGGQFKITDVNTDRIWTYGKDNDHR